MKKEIKMGATMKICSSRLVLLLATAVSLVGYPNPASAATFNVTVGVAHPLGFRFVPSSVTIHPGDQVKWTWVSSGHSTTSGRLGMPDGIILEFVTTERLSLTRSTAWVRFRTIALRGVVVTFRR